TLFFTSGRHQGKTFSIDQSIIKLGRSSKNDIRLHDEEASRFHLEIRRQGSSVAVVDLNSSNGTYVNKERVHLAQLQNGDTITVGGTHILFSNPLEAQDVDSDLIFQISDDFDSDGLLPDGFRKDTVRNLTRVSKVDGSSKDSAEARAPIVVAKAKPTLQVIIDTFSIIRCTNDEQLLLQKILEKVAEMTSADRGGIMLHCPHTKEFLLVASVIRNRNSPVKSVLKVSDTIIRFVTLMQQGVLTNDARADQRWQESDSLVNTGVREAICVPMIGRAGILGLIYVDTQADVNLLNNLLENRRFTSLQLETVNAVAQQTALAIEVSRSYAALIASERLAAIGEVTAIISHNIKNTMQGIKSGAFLIENGLAKGALETVQRGWEIVKKHQEICFNDFLNILSYSVSREPTRVSTSISALLGKVCQLAEPAAQKKGVAIVLPMDLPPTWEFEVDDQGIVHSILNLVLNSIEACDGRANPCVTIACRVLDSLHAEIIVQDNGQGIPWEIQKKLFNEFVTTKGQQGSGLGMMSVKKVIEEHRGKVEFQSIPDVGTKFIVRIPISANSDSIA
ncbi:MAG: ATP-binding protein, partial [Pirellulaceae bacterium]